MSKASTGSSTAHLFDFALSVKVLRAFARRFGGGPRAADARVLNDFMLKDIGLTRADILSAAHGRIARRD